MFETIFDKNATRAIKGGTRWGIFIILLSALMIIIALVRVALKLPPAVYTPGFLVVVLLLFITRKGNVENITFFVQKDAHNNIRYGYHNLDGQRPIFPVDEYSYWYVTGPDNRITLIMQFVSAGNDIYLMEETMDTAPPEGWTTNDLRIKFVPGVFKVPNLEELAHRMDKLST